MGKKEKVGAAQAFVPTDLMEIKKILKEGDLDVLQAERENILKSLGVHLKNQREAASKYLSENVYEKVVEIIKNYCEKRMLTIAPYYDFGRIGVTLCDSNEFKKFMNYDREPRPTMKTEEFNELHTLINEVGKCRIIGETSANGQLIWNIKTMLTGELKENADRLDKIISLAKQRLEEVDARRVEEARENEQMKKKYPPNK